MPSMRAVLDLLREGEDRFTGSTFTDDDGTEFSVERLYRIAQAHPDRFLRRGFPIAEIEHDLEWWENGVANGEQSHAHMRSVDTGFPILVLKQPDGHLSVCDGLNRVKKARDLEHRDTIDAYVVPWTRKMQDACRVDPARATRPPASPPDAS